MAVSEDIARRVLLRELEVAEQVKLAQEHPAHLLCHVHCTDAKTGERFDFQLLDETAGWYWQRGVLDAWLEHPRNLVLKARQIGITWLAGGMALWTALAKPGTRVLVISINETEAVKVVNRIWDMYQSLPRYLRSGIEVLKPAKGSRPSQLIELEHPDGRISSILGLPSTKKAGHGETASLVILDEFARHEYAEDTWTAVVPTMDLGGRVIVISTANGVSNELTGEGNFYHHLWANADDYGIRSSFLPWDLHPLRDANWYETNARALPTVKRAEQYPLTPEDAFINTGECWFDLEALAWYSHEQRLQELYRLQWEEGEAKIRSSGSTRIYLEPEADGEYAIGADVATGRGADYSCAYVIDLGTMDLVAEYHERADSDLFAEQLHYLGHYYNKARIAVEMGGGYGEAVIIPLRDGRANRPPYPYLYRHRVEDRIVPNTNVYYGFPINQKTRPLIINQLEQAIRERSLTGLPGPTISECRTFCKAKTLPSPRAQDGCNDDRVMALALTLEMYRRYGKPRYRPPSKEEVEVQLARRRDGSLDPRLLAKRYPA